MAAISSLARGVGSGRSRLPCGHATALAAAARPGHVDLFLLAFFQNLFHPAPFQHCSCPLFMPTILAIWCSVSGLRTICTGFRAVLRPISKNLLNADGFFTGRISQSQKDSFTFLGVMVVPFGQGAPKACHIRGPRRMNFGGFARFPPRGLPTAESPR